MTCIVLISAFILAHSRPTLTPIIVRQNRQNLLLRSTYSVFLTFVLNTHARQNQINLLLRSTYSYFCINLTDMAKQEYIDKNRRWLAEKRTSRACKPLDKGIYYKNIETRKRPTAQPQQRGNRGIHQRTQKRETPAKGGGGGGPRLRPTTPRAR